MPSRSVFSSCWKFWREPYFSSIALTSFGAAEGDEAGEEAGARERQKREWLICPPPLNLLPLP